MAVDDGGSAGAGAAALLERHDATAPPYVSAGPEGTLARAWLDALLDGDRRRAMAIVEDALADGVDLERIYDEAFTPALREIGRGWQRGSVSVAQQHLATAITQYAMSLLAPDVMAGRSAGGRLIAFCAPSERHEIGARMVADAFELHGWRTRFFRADIATGQVLEAIGEQQPDVVGLSVTMPDHLGAVAEQVAAVRDVADSAVLVGGRPFLVTDGLWRDVGADGTAPGPAEAVAWASDRLDGRRPGP